MFPRPLSMRSATLLPAVFLLLIAYAGAVAPASPAGGKTSAARTTARAKTSGRINTVLISEFKFQPATLTVNAGEIVEWKNADIYPHTATAADGRAFDSGSIAKGASWQFRASKKGTYDYLCTFHPNMKARLIVR